MDLRLDPLFQWWKHVGVALKVGIIDEIVCQQKLRKEKGIRKFSKLMVSLCKRRKEICIFLPKLHSRKVTFIDKLQWIISYDTLQREVLGVWEFLL